MSHSPVTPNTTRREYALLELLRSERIYVSDLVLLRDYQIPLASGQLSSMSSIWPAVDATVCQYLGLGPVPSNTDAGPADPPGSSSRVPHPLTTVSSVSAVSLDSIFTLRPMKTKDVNIVFRNIQQLAAFSEQFLDRLECALGELIEGNVGEDSVGRLFLDSLSQMEPLYEAYVVNQPHALEHYHRLSQTFQFDVYFPKSQILAHKSSNAWDLPSILIKPVQRLLHYPELLAAIIAETPDSHGDKAKLVAAHGRMAEMARRLNARCIQRRVVQEVLAGAGLVNTPRMGDDRTTGKVKTRRSRTFKLKVGLLSPVPTLGRTKAARPDSLKPLETPAGMPEMEVVKAMSERLKLYRPVMTQFRKEIVDWADAMCNMVHALREWATAFGSLVWPEPEDEHSETFKFLVLVVDRWRVVYDVLKVNITEDILWSVSALANSIVAPILLLETMQRLEPLHYELLHLNVSKSHPPPSLLEASQSYLALREQLSEELPTYLTLLDKGMAVCILKFAHVQGSFYSNVRDLWGGLCDAIKIGEETSGGAAETLRIWSIRFSEVEKQLMHLSVVRPPGDNLVQAVSPSRFLDINLGPFKSYDPDTRRRRPSSGSFPDCVSLRPIWPPNIVVTPPPPEMPIPHEKDVLPIPAVYECRVLRPYQPPEGVTYRNLPLFTLMVGEMYEMLAETGLASTHSDLPLHVDKGNLEDYLLLVRHRRTGAVGWALAASCLCTTVTGAPVPSPARSWPPSSFPLTRELPGMRRLPSENSHNQGNVWLTVPYDKS